MLLPEKKEREYRFKLALRMGLPIFALILAFVSSILTQSYESLHPSFYFTAILLLVFSIYFIFFLIYKGFDERITETVSKTFTREYLYKYLNKKMKEEYTLILLSIDNLATINTNYGIKNGDKILHEVVVYISSYLKEKNIRDFPMGHIKGGDFIIGLRGKKEDYNIALELLCLKSSELKIDNIEVSLSGAIIDTNFSNDLNYMIEGLFELQEENKNKKVIKKEELINPNDLESYVINALKKEQVTIISQDIYENNKPVMQEYFTRLQDPNGKLLHPKSYMKAVHKLGLTAEHDYIILKNCIKQYSSKKEGLFCLNIHPTSLRDRNFLDKVKNIIEENLFVKEKIVFMFYEKEYYSQKEKYNYTLQTLRKNGIKIAVDKLGLLHTSFLYLRDLDIDIVRFDSLYTKEIDKDTYKSTVEGFNVMAHEKGVKTWLKMIQTKEIQELTDTLKIDYMQGKALSEIKK